MSNAHKSVALPSSKSISNRLLLLNKLHGGPLTLSNLSKAEDTIYLDNVLNKQQVNRYVGEGGTSLRFAMTYFSSQNFSPTEVNYMATSSYIDPILSVFWPTGSIL